MGADPDVLPRTSNFGVDYIAFSAICPDCPPNFLQLTFNCVRVSKIKYHCTFENTHELKNRRLGLTRTKYSKIYLILD